MASSSPSTEAPEAASSSAADPQQSLFTPKRVDRFGFEMKPATPAEFDSPLHRRAAIDRENTRVKKWVKMMAGDGRSFRATKAVKLLSRCWKGIPDAIRGEAWQRMLGSREGKPLSHAAFEELSSSAKEEWCDRIELDLDRTFPEHLFFAQRGGCGQSGLGSVLRACAATDVEVGYCQGMAFVAATARMYMTEEEAASFLITLLESPFSLRGVYLPGFPRLQLLLYQLSGLVRVLLPRLHKHLSSLFADDWPTMLCTQWYMTLFVYALPFATTIRVWDVALCVEPKKFWKVMHRVALAIFRILESKLLAMDMDGILMGFKNELLDPTLSVDRLLDEARAVKITTKQLVALEAEFNKK